MLSQSHPMLILFIINVANQTFKVFNPSKMFQLAIKARFGLITSLNL